MINRKPRNLANQNDTRKFEKHLVIPACVDLICISPYFLLEPIRWTWTTSDHFYKCYGAQNRRTLVLALETKWKFDILELYERFYNELTMINYN